MLVWLHFTFLLELTRIRFTICLQNFGRKAEILVVKAADFN